MRRRLALVVALVGLGLLLGAPAWLLGTSVGARWVAEIVEMRAPLSFAGVEGSVLRGLRLERLVYADERTSVRVDDLSLRLNLRCVLRGTLCIPAVSAAAVAVDVGPGQREREPADDPLAFLAVLPGIEIDDLQVGNLAVTLAGERHELRDLEAAGAASSAGFVVDRARACHDLACARVGGRLSAAGRWDVEGEAGFEDGALERLVPVETVVLPRAYRLSAAGDRRAASARLTSPPEPALALEARIGWGEALTLAATLEGLEILAPDVTANPWLGLRGPLDLDLHSVPGGTQVDLRQDVAGYGATVQPLALSLRHDGAELELLQATLGTGEATRLRATGTLGQPDALRPDLHIEFRGLDLPEATGVPVRDLRGSADLRVDVRNPLESWMLGLEDIAFTENERDWRGSGRLAAVPGSPFPLGDLVADLRDPALDTPTPLRVEYGRSDAAGPATLRAPRGLTLGEREFRLLELSLAPDGPGALTVRARSEGAVTTDLQARVEETDEGARGLLEPFRMRWEGNEVRSPQATEFAWLREAGAVRVGAFCLRLRGSRACSSGAEFGPAGALELALTLNERVEGVVGGKRFAAEARGPGVLALHWTDWSPDSVRASADLTRLALDPFVGVETAPPVVWETARFEGSYAAGTGTLQADLVSSTAGSLAADVGIEGGRLEGRITAEELFLPALSDFVPELSVEAGRAGAELSVAGTPEAPEFTGTAQIRDALLRLDVLDSQLDELNLDARFDGQRVAVRGEARLGGGALGLEAVCCEDDRLRGTLIGSRNRVRLPVGLDALFSPSLDIDLAPSELTITGSLAVHEGVFEHSALQEGGVAVSADVRRIDAPENTAQRFDLTLDLRTLIEPGFVLRSRQLESILSGDLRLMMAPRTPASLFGNLEVLGGELRAYGQALRLTEGSLGFVGNPLNPDLAISAEREIRTENQRVGFRVRGTLEEPLFELFSDPRRSNDVTLSYLLRGRGPDVGVAADGTAMALSLGASAVNQSGVLASLNSLPGLSGVTLGAEGTDEDMAATISAYVGNRLYLSYGVGIYEPVNALTVRLFLRSRLWLEVVSRLESSFDLYYRFDWN